MRKLGLEFGTKCLIGFLGAAFVSALAPSSLEAASWQYLYHGTKCRFTVQSTQYHYPNLRPWDGTLFWGGYWLFLENFVTNLSPTIVYANCPIPAHLSSGMTAPNLAFVTVHLQNRGDGALAAARICIRDRVGHSEQCGFHYAHSGTGSYDVLAYPWNLVQYDQDDVMQVTVTIPDYYPSGGHPAGLLSLMVYKK